MGKMGEALVQGLTSSDPKLELRGTTRSLESATRVEKELKIPCKTDNRQLAAWADIVILCVKPHQVPKVLGEIQGALTRKKLLISIAAAITTQQLSAGVRKKCATVRAMPNTPALIGQGMTVLCPGPDATETQLKMAQSLFDSVGTTTTVEESLMDGVTGLSGCGPAYVYLMIEALSEAGVKVGLPRDKATLLAAQTLMGSAQMVLERGQHPAALKDEVTTPAGCTIDGLMALEEGKLRVTLIKAVLAATKRSVGLRAK
jgi:pyrroline-5-carboxylate reductase